MQEMCCGGLIMTRERGPEDLQGKSVCVCLCLHTYTTVVFTILTTADL